MKKLLLLLCFVTAAHSFVFADAITINHFVVKENPFAIDQVAIVATDTAGVTQEKVNGLFTFVMNGFEYQLKFEKGVAFYRQKIDRSTFLYAKHMNETGTHAILYYIYKHDSKLSPWHISWVLLVAIPLILVLLAYMFKRFIIIAVIIFCIFLYFNYHNNLSIPTFFESIIDGLKNML